MVRIITQNNGSECTQEEITEVAKYLESYNPQIISVDGVAYINYELHKMLLRTTTPYDASIV
jgi:hypothetical protein